jgi:RimJ/RimL family protein N-acetyltransferase
MIPELSTPRLRLRAPVPSDLDSCLALWSDEAVVRHITGVPQSREAVWARLLRYAGHWAWLGFGYWIVERVADGAFVGEVGFLAAKRDIVPPLGDGPEMGWVLRAAMQGQGYAAEAAAAALAWRDAALPGDTVCIISPHNAASLRLAGRLGFSVVTETRYHDHEVRILRRPARIRPDEGRSG